MTFSDIELPTNKKFGLFFAAVFAIAFAYFFYNDALVTAWIFAGLAIIFAVLAVTKSEILLPLNKLWMRVGLLLGMIVSPIVLGLIYFVIFTPVGVVMRLVGRDELRLKTKDAPTHWKTRDQNQPSAESFKYQY